MAAATVRRQVSAPTFDTKVDVSKVQALSAAVAGPMWSPPPFIDPTEMMSAMQTAGVTSDGEPSKLFAEVYKDGKLVARLYNGGSSATYGAADGIITGENEPYDGGPQLAQWRANKIASALGGTVKQADTAQTQSQWDVTHAADQARLDQAMAPYRAAMDAWNAKMDAWNTGKSTKTSATA
ncbi:MAG TPA: hypothetical protein VN157_16425 [Caulobacter sp.]|nr:hypothetical protein [Caulobacter sp.]